ncbi:MAG: TlpA family protein disulfide reductase [candidate division KSB1 bacterium]|nr:TlpA family protein disulfide reductase [candidate division KSB1 bacterium]
MCHRIQILALTILIALTSVPLFCQEVQPDARGYIVNIGDQVENFAVTLLDGRIQRLSEFKAQVLVLNFFASWCAVCRKEIPHIEREIWQPLQDRGVVVLGVDYQEQPDTAKRMVQDMSISYPVALDIDGQIFSRFARGGVTRNVVLDRNLNIIFLTRLFDPAEFASMKEVIQQQIRMTSDSLDTHLKRGQEILLENKEIGKTILLKYAGQHQIHLEGRMQPARWRKMQVGVSLFKEDIVSHKYDKKSKTLAIVYRHYDGMRIAVLPMTMFKVPRDIEQIVIVDAQ